MIQTLVDGVDADKYIYKTQLDFGLEFGERLRVKALEDESYFVPRANYENGLKDPWSVYEHIGLEKSRELMRRYKQIKNTYPGESPIEFRQFYLPDDAAEELLSITPQFLKDLSPGEPVPIFQIGDGGSVLPTHKGHKRKSSIFLLLQSNDEETRWYRETEPFEIIPTTRIPDLNKIEHVVSAKIEKGNWFVFNHLEWHSVHRYGNSKRINVGLDFDNVRAEDLVQAIKEYEKTLRV